MPWSGGRPAGLPRNYLARFHYCYFVEDGKSRADLIRYPEISRIPNGISGSDLLTRSESKLKSSASNSDEKG